MGGEKRKGESRSFPLKDQLGDSSLDKVLLRRYHRASQGSRCRVLRASEMMHSLFVLVRQTANKAPRRVEAEKLAGIWLICYF